MKQFVLGAVTMLLLVTTLGVTAAILGLVDSSTGALVDPDSRYVQPPASNGNCYVMQNATWVQVTCP